jgi:hypothetical protein
MKEVRGNKRKGKEHQAREIVGRIQSYIEGSEHHSEKLKLKSTSGAIMLEIRFYQVSKFNHRKPPSSHSPN